MKIRILYILTCLTLIGCATFSKKEFKKELIKLDKNEALKISGKYKLYPHKEFGRQSSYSNFDSLKKHGNLYQSIVNETWEKRKGLDSLIKEKDDYYIDLQIANGNVLKISLFEKNILIKDTLFNGKIKNGMFYIDNHYYKMTGIPYLAGGYESNKRRIGLSKSGNLIVNKAVSNEGAVLLIIGTGHAYNDSKVFERVN